METAAVEVYHVDSCFPTQMDEIAFQRIGHTVELHHITYRYNQKSYIKMLFLRYDKVTTISEKTVTFIKIGQE